MRRIAQCKNDNPVNSMAELTKSVRVYRTDSYKMIKMYLKIQDIFTRPNEVLPDMSGGKTQFREDWYGVWSLLQ